MKVVHINTNDQGGGAAIAASRHCEAMLQKGIDAKLLSMNKVSHRPYVEKIHLGLRNILSQIFRILHQRLVFKLKPTGTFSIMEFGHPLHKNKDVIEADVIFIHWVNQNYLSIRGVESILKLGKPTIWYMHDMFPITGGCHHSMGCNGYNQSCSDCPLIKGRDKYIPKVQLKSKIKHWKKYSNLIFVTPSKWLADCVRTSTLAQGHYVKVVPNTIDTKLFKPLPFDCKMIFGLDLKKKTILISADLSGSIYKGSQYTVDCLKLLDSSKYEGLIIGNMPDGLQDVVPIRLIATGYLTDQLSLVLAYNACDIVLITSIAENYPNIVLEAMACGKPCVGFAVGGIPDLIIDGETGYLCSEKSADVLFEKLVLISNDHDTYCAMSVNARQQILKNNSYSKVIDDLCFCISE